MLSALLRGILLAVLCAGSAHAEGISVNKAEVRAVDEGYQLSASYDIELNPVLQQALSRGIPLYFVCEFSLTRSRWYWLNKVVFQGGQTFKLTYNVLAQQYRISRGALFQNFASLEDALNILSRQSSAPIPPEMLKSDSGYIASLIKGNAEYFAAVRLRLDSTQLPKLLQVNALTDNDWTLDSDWYRWVINPADIAGHNGNNAE